MTEESLSKSSFKEMLLESAAEEPLMLSIYEASHPAVCKLVDERKLKYLKGQNAIYSPDSGGKKFIVRVGLVGDSDEEEPVTRTHETVLS